MATLSTVAARLAPNQPSSRRAWVVVAVLLTLAAAVVIGLQSRGGLATSSSGSMIGAQSADVGAPAAPAPSSAREGAVQDKAAANGATALDEPVVGPKLAKTAWLGVRVRDLTTGTDSVRSIAIQAGGQVVSENVVTAAGPAPDIPNPESNTLGMPPVSVDEARLTLRVPSAKLDGVLTELSRVGTESYRSSQSEDVTDAYVDTKARITTAEDAVGQARVLLAKATTLGQIIELENEVNRRQADLDSLRSRMATLERRTTTADVTVTLWTAATVPAAMEPNAFVSQLRTAWDHFLGSISVILTGLAVLLPWIVIALLVTLVVRRWLRRHPVRPATGAPAATTPAD